MKEIPYYGQLEKIRGEMRSRLPGFPRGGWCLYTARVLRRSIGLEEVSGGYLPFDHFHVWNYDPKRGLYVDLTHDQFADDGKEIPGVVVLPSTCGVLQLDDSYIRVQRTMSDEEIFLAMTDNKVGVPTIADMVRMLELS